MESFVINNRYKITTKLGHGGNADVYLAFDTITKRNIAIKYLRNIVNENDGNYKKFKQEITTMAAISHKNVVRIYDTGIFLDKPYVAMEYIRGKSLRALIQQQGYLLVEEVKSYMLQILDGLACCHDLGIIHRDVKPENMLVKSDGTLVIIDFGTAFVLQKQLNIYEEDRLVGTLQYMAPEYLDNIYGSVQVDIYALGISMFEMFTGKLPFTHPQNDAREIFRMHRHKPLPDIKAFNPKVPDSFIAIIKKATEKKAADRYKNIYELKCAILQAYEEYIHPELYKKGNLFTRLFKKKGQK